MSDLGHSGSLLTVDGGAKWLDLKAHVDLSWIACFVILIHLLVFYCVSAITRPAIFRGVERLTPFRVVPDFLDLFLDPDFSHLIFCLDHSPLLEFLYLALIEPLFTI